MTQSVLFRSTVAISTAALSWVSYWGLLRWIGVQDPILGANLVMSALAFHEMGHLLAMQRHGVRGLMFFAVVVGGVAPINMGKYLTLPAIALFEIAMAGVVGNAIAIALGVMMATLGIISWDMAMSIANINAALIFFNLIPIPPFDGGRAMKILFDSVPEQRDIAYILGVSGVVIAAGIALLAVGQAPLLPIALYLFGLARTAADDDPHGSMSASAMSASQACWSARFFSALSAVSLIVMLATPPWI